MTATSGAGQLFIGLMSGTSADGMDAALVDFSGVQPHILGSQSLQYPPELRKRIRLAASSPRLEVRDLLLLDRELGETAAQLVQELLEKTKTPAHSIAAVGSHGQTIRHLPEDGCTWQIGDPNRIAQITGLTTIADFRRRDVAAGGQGAPLTPAFHESAFRSTGETRVVMNLGGIANLTHLPEDPARKATGYDTGPANRLMDHWTQSHREQPFDRDGRWAASGECSAELLADMLGDSYFSLPAPKSTGPERFHGEWLNARLKRHPGLTVEDIQATLLEFTAASVAREVQKLDPVPAAVFLCGGGAANPVLVRRIEANLEPIRVSTTEELGVPPQLVEPTAFAWLAMRTLAGQPGNLPAVTGAGEPVILGAVYPGAATAG